MINYTMPAVCQPTFTEMLARYSFSNEFAKSETPRRETAGAGKWLLNKLSKSFLWPSYNRCPCVDCDSSYSYS